MKKIFGRTKTIIIMSNFFLIFIFTVVSPAEELVRDGRFIAYNDETVLDTQTNLLWAAGDNGEDIDWPDAEMYCKNYNGGGYKDWRMPTQQELNGLYDRLILGNNGYRLTKLITLSGAFPWASEVSGSEGAYVSFYYDRDIWCWDPLSRKKRHRALPVRYGREPKVVKIEEPPPPPPPMPEKVTITLYVEFDHDKNIVKEIYHDEIKKVSDFMKKYPNTKAEIEGHTDEIGTKEYNQRLSEERAKSVRRYLIDKFAIHENRLTSVGYGEDRPIADNYTLEGRRKNRRVEAVISTIVTK